MGKGDKRTAKGKRFKGSFGVSRMKASKLRRIAKRRKSGKKKKN